MKFFLLLSLFLCSFLIKATSQTGDFIVVRKIGINVKTFFKGGYARFITTSGEWIESKVLDIRNDSLFFKEILVRQLPTQFGVMRADTLATPIRGIAYSDIGAIPRSNENFTYIKNGAIFMVGSAGFALLNLVNGAYLHYAPFGKKNLPGLVAATGVFAGGFLLHKLYRPYRRIGKKYKVVYIKG